VRAEKYHRAALRVASRCVASVAPEAGATTSTRCLRRLIVFVRNLAKMPPMFHSSFSERGTRASAGRFPTPAAGRGRIPPRPRPRARRYGGNFARGVGAPPARQGEGKKNPLSFRPFGWPPTTIPVDAMARSARISKSHFPSVELGDATLGRRNSAKV